MAQSRPAQTFGADRRVALLLNICAVLHHVRVAITAGAGTCNVPLHWCPLYAAVHVGQIWPSLQGTGSPRRAIVAHGRPQPSRRPGISTPLLPVWATTNVGAALVAARHRVVKRPALCSRHALPGGPSTWSTVSTQSTSSTRDTHAVSTNGAGTCNVPLHLRPGYTSAYAVQTWQPYSSGVSLVGPRCRWPPTAE